MSGKVKVPGMVETGRQCIQIVRDAPRHSPVLCDIVGRLLERFFPCELAHRKSSDYYVRDCRSEVSAMDLYEQNWNHR
jgi:hypothetical protein